jgi:hypothetical protein
MFPPFFDCGETADTEARPIRSCLRSLATPPPIKGTYSFACYPRRLLHGGLDLDCDSELPGCLEGQRKRGGTCWEIHFSRRHASQVLHVSVAGILSFLSVYGRLETSFFIYQYAWSCRPDVGGENFMPQRPSTKDETAQDQPDHTKRTRLEHCSLWYLNLSSRISAMLSLLRLTFLVAVLVPATVSLLLNPCHRQGELNAADAAACRTFWDAKYEVERDQGRLTAAILAFMRKKEQREEADTDDPEEGPSNGLTTGEGCECEVFDKKELRSACWRVWRLTAKLEATRTHLATTMAKTDLSLGLTSCPMCPRDNEYWEGEEERCVCDPGYTVDAGGGCVIVTPEPTAGPTPVPVLVQSRLCHTRLRQTLNITCSGDACIESCLEACMASSTAGGDCCSLWNEEGNVKCQLNHNSFILDNLFSSTVSWSVMVS